MNRIVAGCVFVFVLAAGCRSIPPYTVGLKNTGKATVYEAHVYYDGFVSAGGVLAPGTLSMHLLPDVPIPQTAEVRWQTEDGSRLSRKVDVRSVVQGRSMSDTTLLFTIGADNNVSVSVRNGP